MKLIVIYVLFVLIGDVGSYLIGRTAEQWLSQSLSLAIFLGCFFAVFAVAWVLAVRVTEPRTS
jgi:uncharacterized membrane protein